MSHSDLNECGIDRGGCTYKCINMAGSHRCECPNGTTGCYGGEQKLCMVSVKTLKQEYI